MLSEPGEVGTQEGMLASHSITQLLNNLRSDYSITERSDYSKTHVQVTEVEVTQLLDHKHYALRLLNFKGYEYSD